MTKLIMIFVIALAFTRYGRKTPQGTPITPSKIDAAIEKYRRCASTRTSETITLEDLVLLRMRPDKPAR